MVSSATIDPGTASAIRQALQEATRGRIADARRIGEVALAKGGDIAALNAMLGTFCLSSGEYERAVLHLEIAREKRPDDVLIAFNLATALTQLGRYTDALIAVPEPLARGDETCRLDRLRAFCAQSVEEFETAISAYERVLARNVTDWESWNNLGNCRRCTGDFGKAIEALRRAARLVPDAPPVRLNLATALLEAGNTDEGEVELKAIAKDFPNDWRCLRQLHLHFRSQNQEEKALEAIEEASRRNTEDLELLLAVASQRLLLLDNAGAESAYREVVNRDPRNSSGNLGLAVVYELANRSDDLAALVGEARSRGVDDHVLNFIAAFDHRRAQRFDQGLVAMDRVEAGLEEVRQAHLLGQLHEGAGNYDAAWCAFSRMNEIQRLDPSRPEQRGAAYRRAVREKLEETTVEWARHWKQCKLQKDQASPVFLVGFPRSGTTLLDTILMGHPQVEVLEEEPTLHRAAEMLSDYAHLPQAPHDVVASARERYFEDVAKKTAMAPGKLIIDKNPLSMLAIPLIKRLFPDAKIILALRHPCDVVLSCFMTNFRLNDGMSSFLRLDTTAELYDLSFAYFERATQLLPVSVQPVVYEKLVEDREHELRPLFEYLGLSWTDDVMDHQTTALRRGRIKTASYAQVAQPIYSRSAGRWRHYHTQLEPVLPVLKPWIEKFGYEV